MIPICICAIEDESDREYMIFLYHEYRKLMYKTILNSGCDAGMAEDVLQTTLEKLIDKIPLLKTFDRDRLVNYIISACRHNAYNERRYESRHGTVGIEDQSHEPVDPRNYADEVEEHLLLAEEISCLECIWPRLEPRTQYLLTAKYILGKDAAEIARELGIKPGSVRMALTRARKEAYALLAEELKT